MKPLTKIFLAGAIGATLIGFSGIGTSIFWTLAKPVGAIFFVAFLIFYFLEDESEKYLRDEQRKQDLYFGKPPPANPVAEKVVIPMMQPRKQTAGLEKVAAG